MNKTVNNIFSTKDIFEHALEYISTTHDCNRFDIKTTDVSYIEKLIIDVDTLRVQYGIEGCVRNGVLIRGASRTAKYTKVCDKNGKPLWRYEGRCTTDTDGEYNINLSLFDEEYHLEVVVETTTAKHTMRFARVSCWDGCYSISDIIDGLHRAITDLDYDDDEGYRRLTEEVVALSEATTLQQVLSIITPEEKDGGFNDIIYVISGSRTSINEIIVSVHGTLTRLHVDRDGCIIYPILSVFSDGQLSPIHIEYDDDDGSYSISSMEEKVINA